MTTNKKYYKYLLLVLLILPLTVHAEAVGENMCAREEIQNVMKFVGYIIMFIKDDTGTNRKICVVRLQRLHVVFCSIDNNWPRHIHLLQ